MSKKKIEVCQHGESKADFLQIVTAAANKLKENEVLSLEFKDIEMLSVLGNSAYAQSIVELKLDPKQNVIKDTPELLTRFPQLVSLFLISDRFTMLDAASAILEHPKTKLTKLHIACPMTGNCSRFFTALQQSQVTELQLCTFQCVLVTKEFVDALAAYLAQDLLTPLSVLRLDHNVDNWLVSGFANCSRLRSVLIRENNHFGGFQLFPRSVTDIFLFNVTLSDNGTAGLCEFLINNSITRAEFYMLKSVDENQLAASLLQCASRLQSLLWGNEGMSKETVFQLLQIMQIKGNQLNSLHMIYAYENDWFVDALSEALTHENCRLRILTIGRCWPWIRDEKDVLIRALNHKNCLLQQFYVYDYDTPLTYEERQTLESIRLELNKGLKHRHMMFTFLSGQQVRRLGKYGVLRRLPVEVFRLVEMMLHA